MKIKDNVPHVCVFDKDLIYDLHAFEIQFPVLEIRCKCLVQDKKFLFRLCNNICF